MSAKKTGLMENQSAAMGGMQHRDYQKELQEIIAGNNSPALLKKKISGYHEGDIAAVLPELSPSDRLRLYHVLDSDALAEIFEYLDDMSPYLSELGVRKKADVLSCMDADATADYLKGLDKNERGMLVELLEESAKQDIALLLSFDEDEIGSIMTTNHIEITPGLSVREAMHELIRQAADNDNVSTIYVVDERHVFYGAIDLKDLIIARENTELETIIKTSYPYVYAQEQIDDCLARIRNYSEDSIPVLDNENRLLGVITAQDFMQVVDDEMGEDYAKLGGLAAEEDLSETVKESARKRLPWLVILLGLGIVVSSVVGMFENVVAQLTIVVCFQSLVLDMAGNVGTQSLAVTIRVLTDEKLGRREKLSLVTKETRVGLINGAVLAVISFVVIGLYVWLFKGYPLGFSFAVSACSGVALLLAMTLSALTGTVIPMFFKKINVDPAVASGPLITTVNDLVAVVAYYGLAWLFFIQVLHLQG